MSWRRPPDLAARPAVDFGGVRLSARLAAVAHTIEGGVSVADIGTDHGRLAAALVMTGRASRVVAVDVNAGPLQQCAQTLTKYDVQSRVQMRHGFGLQPLEVGEVDVAVACGMGGHSIAELLETGDPAGKGIRRLVLQPQRNLPRVYEALRALGYQVTSEARVPDGRRVYAVLTANLTID